MAMPWLEERIHRYEHRRWTTDDNRRVLPFGWGLEYIIDGADNRAAFGDPRKFLEAFAADTVARSDEWYAAGPANDYRLHPPENSGSTGRVLTFTSAVKSAWPENNIVHAR